MSRSTQPIGVLGGTFDPVHFGHLRPALELCEGLKLDQVRLIPSRTPVHRGDPVAPLEERIQWLQRAVEGVPQLLVDLREVERESPSWMVLTLESLQREFPAQPLCLILGMDAFLQLESWHRWRELSDYAHIVVTHRPGFEHAMEGALGIWSGERVCSSIEELHRLPEERGGGRVFYCPVTQLEISATGIRTMVGRGEDPRFLLPDLIREEVMSCYYEKSHKECS